MTDQEITNRGTDAEEFKRYLEERPYFTSVVAVAKQMIWNNIASLRPDETIKFTVLKSQLTGVEELMSLIEMDIEAGQKALARMQGVNEVKKNTYGEGDVL